MDTAEVFRRTVQVVLHIPRFVATVPALIKSEQRWLTKKLASIGALCRQLMDVWLKDKDSVPIMMFELVEDPLLDIFEIAETNYKIHLQVASRSSSGGYDERS